MKLVWLLNRFNETSGLVVEIFFVVSELVAS